MYWPRFPLWFRSIQGSLNEESKHTCTENRKTKSCVLCTKEIQKSRQINWVLSIKLSVTFLKHSAQKLCVPILLLAQIVLSKDFLFSGSKMGVFHTPKANHAGTTAHAIFDCRIHRPGPVDENNGRIVTWRFDTLKYVSFSLSLGGFDVFYLSCHHLYRPFQYFRWYPSASFRNVFTLPR